MPTSESTPQINRIDAPVVGRRVNASPVVVGPRVSGVRVSGVRATDIRATDVRATDVRATGPRLVGQAVADNAPSRPRRTPSDKIANPLSGHRIDASHAQVAADDLSPKSQINREDVRDASPLIDRESWLRLHAAELIRRLQTWANGLDAREATLNAAFARQDLRERQFRLQQNEFQAEMDAAEQAADELHQKVAAQSRRLAFQSLR